MTHKILGCRPNLKIAPNQLVSLSVCLTKFFFNSIFVQINSVCFTWCLSHSIFVWLDFCQSLCFFDSLFSHLLFVQSNVCPTQGPIWCLSHCIFVQFDFHPTNVSPTWCSSHLAFVSMFEFTKSCTNMNLHHFTQWNSHKPKFTPFYIDHQFVFWVEKN